MTPAALAELHAWHAERDAEHIARMEARARAIIAFERLQEGTRKDAAARERRERLDANEAIVRWQPLPIIMVWRGEHE